MRKSIFKNRIVNTMISNISTKEYTMSKSRFARIATGLLFALFYVIGCSDVDTGVSSDQINERNVPINSVGKTEDGHEVLVFQEGDLENILFQIDTITMSETEGFTGKLLFRNLDEEKIPKTGDIIVSGQTTMAEYGFLYKVLEISTVDGVTAIEVRSASLEEAIEDIDFESETEFQFDEDGNFVGALQKVKSSTFGELLLNIPPIPIKIDGVEIGKIGANIATTTSLIFDISIKKWNLQSTKMTLVQDGNIKVKGSLGNFGVKGRPELMTPKHLGTITFFVGPIPVVITNELVLEWKLKSEIQAGIEATYTLNGRGEYGFEWRNGGFHRITEHNFNQSFNLEHRLSGNARIGVIFGLRSMLYGSAGFIIGAGPVIDLYVGGNPVGTHVFDNGFRGDYSGYRSIWAGTGITDLDMESGSADINIAINNSGSTTNSNFLRTIANEARTDLGIDFEAIITLKVLKHELLRYTFAETNVKLHTLYRTSFLPLFDEPQIVVNNADVAVSSQIERDFLNYPVNSYGICVEKPYSDECRNGQGIREVIDGPVSVGARHNFTTTFSNLSPGQTYAIRPYFSTGTGTYYDKAIPYTHDVEYTLTTNKNLANGGTLLVNGVASIEPTPHKHGTHVRVTAVENPGYEFTGWSGASTSTNSEVIVTMSSNQALTANYQPRKYTLTTYEAPTTSGSITRSTEASSYSFGTIVTVTATEKSGYKFIGWAGASTSENSTVAITMDSDKTLIAMFSSLSATTTYPALTPISDPPDGGEIIFAPEWLEYNHGAEITVTANPNPSYRFIGWSGAATGTANPATIIMGEETPPQITANFERITYSLTTNVSLGDSVGVVSRDDGDDINNTYTVGTQVTVTATAQPHYRFVGWSGDATGTTNPLTITMDANKTLTANFERITYTLTVNRNITSGGTVSGGGTYYSGDRVTVTATPNSNYVFTDWSGAAQGKTNPLTINSMDSNTTLTANFTRVYTFDTTFNTSTRYNTFNKGTPVTVEIYALGAGGGGQGGHSYNSGFLWLDQNCGTGGAGGGGAATYMKFNDTGSIDLDIVVGTGGVGSSAHDSHNNFDRSAEQGGGQPSTNTIITRRGYQAVTVEGGHGGGGAGTSLLGGGGGRESTRPYWINVVDWFSSPGNSGADGHKTNLEVSRGGNAGTIPANTGHLTTTFSGGNGGYRAIIGSACSPSGSTTYGAGIGAGGAGGVNSKNDGSSGGNGRVRIIIKYTN